MKFKHINSCFYAMILLMMSCKGSEKTSVGSSGFESKIDSIVAEMTLEEKIGQMTQLTLDVIGKGNSVYESTIPFTFDEAMLDTVFNIYKVGSILNAPSNTPQTVDEWAKIIKTIQERGIKATGIPVMYGADEIHGTTYTVGGTLFPQQVAMGATFNRALVQQGSEICAYETKASNIPWNFSPVLDLGRNPSWSRMWETYGEDAYLVSEMGAASVLGYQGSDPNNVGQNHVAACLKHFMGYGAAISGKDRTPSMISEREMREKQFAPFLAAIRQGALSVMVNSGVNDGLPLHMNKELIQGWLKDDLKWDGLVVTDWNDINNLYTRDRIVATKKEAIELAINAGIDMSMVPYEWEFCNLLKELVNEKRVAMSRIDDAVKRVLRMKYRLNLFDKPYWSSSDYPLFGSEQHAEKAYESACEAITLLKNNDNVLPLNKKAKVLLTGPNANSMRTLNGGWSLSWQGEKVEQFAQQYNTILEAIENKIGKENILFNEGVSYNHSGKYFEEIVGNYDQVLSDARKADYIVVCVGENSYCETPGNLDDLYLSDNQQNLIKVLAKANKPIILVLNEGRPRLISKVEPHAAGIVQTYLPGNYGGDALVDILFGDVNPSGKLPYTYPKYPNTLITYDHKPCESIGTMTGVYNYDAQSDVQYAFGYGLSYTKFEYSELTVDKTEFGSEDELNVSVKISNTGGRDGKEAALVFVSDLIASLTPDVRRLRGFDKVALKAGESKVVTFKIKASDLAFVNSDGKWILENGEYMVQIGNVSSLIKCVKGNIWENPNID